MNNWEEIVKKTREQVVKKYPQLFNSLDFGAYIEPQNYFISYIFKTNAELKFAQNKGLTDEINQYNKELLKANGYPEEAIKNCDFASQQDCEKNYKGNWYYYYK